MRSEFCAANCGIKPGDHVIWNNHKAVVTGVIDMPYLEEPIDKYAKVVIGIEVTLPNGETTKMVTHADRISLVV